MRIIIRLSIFLFTQVLWHDMLLQVPVEIKEDLSMEVRPMKVLDWSEKKLLE
jgi:hypothetical protein